ncbi:hypothetical protein [Isoptericola haloaureus]|uniref:Peptidase M1 membrane alanine aminopeptidase domain-containing protein n=1 Tax=Isoptericola haloaureus TaxID=1542902 RepID=A0ABU7Z5W2_9MICO
MTPKDRTARIDRGRPVRRLASALLATALALAGVVVPAAVPTALPTAAADTAGLTEEGHARYTVRAKGSVTAEVTSTITNVLPDRGGRSYYWDSYGIVLPTSARDVTATSGGYPLTVRFEDGADATTHVAVASFAPLRYGRTRTIEWRYDIAGDPVRSESWTRVGPGYATFAAVAPGDEGRATLEVVAPRSMQLDTPADVRRDRDGKRVVYTLAADEDGVAWAPVSLRDPDRADTRDVRVGDHVMTVHGFRGDTEWSRFAAEQVEVGIPVLEDLVGADWPANVHRVRQDSSPNVLGYGGWFSRYEREIVVDESLDVGLLLHELTHAWFNHATLDDRWLVEGVTEVVSQRAVERTGAESPAREAPRRKSDVAFPLATWEPAFTLDDDAEAYGYDAAYTVVQRLTADLDDDAFRALMSDVHDGASRYAAPDRPGQFRGITDWRRFLDLLEAHDVGEGAEKTLRRWVLDRRGKEVLADRAEARETYTALDAADGDWLPPQGLRSTMTWWSFGAAEQAVEALGDAPRHAAEVQQVAGDTGLPVPDGVREAYETARNEDAYTALAAMLTETATTMDRVASVSAQVAAEQDPVTELGRHLLEVDASAADARAALADGELEQARDLVAATTEQADRAQQVGLAVVGGALLVLGLLVLVPWLVVRGVRRRRRRRAVLTAPRVVAVVAAPETVADRERDADTEDAMS